VSTAALVFISEHAAGLQIANEERTQNAFPWEALRNGLGAYLRSPWENPNKIEDTEGHKPVAMCIAGTARTFVSDSVTDSLNRFVEQVGMEGMANSSRPDLFAMLAVDDEVAYSSMKPKNDSYSDVVQALRKIHAVSFSIADSPVEVVEDDIDSLVQNRDTCFSGPGFWQNPKHFARSLNQLVHIQKCLQLVKEYEEARAKEYSVIVIARPDIVYDKVEPSLLADVLTGTILHHRDWFMAMPRRYMNQLLPDETGKLLHCKPGMPCCGKVTRSEDMLELFLGVPMSVGEGRSCGCSPKRTKSSEITVGDIPSTHR